MVVAAGYTSIGLVLAIHLDYRTFLCPRIHLSYGVKMRNLIKKLLNSVKPYFRRFNQVVICMPIWLVLGISGRFKDCPKRGEWVKTSRNANLEKRY